MEIIVSVIGELISGVLEWFMDSKRVPKIVRIALVALLLGVPSVFGIMLLFSAESAGEVFFILLVLALFAALGVKSIRKIVKQRSDD